MPLVTCSVPNKIDRDREIRSVTHEVNTNAGGFKVKQEGELPNYGRVPLDKEAMTNILSVGVMSDKYRITMDTAKENAFFVHTPKKIVKFARNPAYLYTHAPSRMPKGKAATAGVHKKVMFVQSVEENKMFHTPREIKKAKIVRDLLAALGTPSKADLKKL